MPVQAGQLISVEFTLRNALTSIPQDADSLPSGKFILNGADAGSVTVEKKTGNGKYKASGNVPSNATVGQQIQIVVTAVVDDLEDSDEVWQESIGCDDPCSSPTVVVSTDTSSDDLLATRTNLIAALRINSINPKPSYSIDGQSVSWDAYRNALIQQIEQINRLIAVIQGPWEVVHEGVT